MCRRLAFSCVLLASLPVVAQEKDLAETARKSVQDYVIRPAGDSAAAFDLVADPVVRFTEIRIDEGDVLIWTRKGRPEVAAQVFLWGDEPNKIWLHEFQSLSSEPIVLQRAGRTLWEPTEKGVAWTALPAEFAPAESPTVRLTQMKRLARRFTGNEQTPGVGGDAENLKEFEMRMKPREVFRYSSPDNGAVDGAMFSFVMENRADPELLLMIEADANGGGWRYAYAPLSCWPMQILLDGEEIASFPNRLLKTTASQPYHVWEWK
jgi:hypothetical protein